MSNVKCPLCKSGNITKRAADGSVVQCASCTLTWWRSDTDHIVAALELAREEAEARVAAERDTYLATIRETFRVLESRGQAPDDNAPLSVTVRRVLNVLDRVTAERDALATQLVALKKRVADAPRTEVLNDADIALTAAAPYLLAEVERLRGWLDFISENPRGGHVTYVHAQNALNGVEVPK